MTQLRLTPSTSIQFASLRSLVARVNTALATGTTTTTALAKARADLAQIGREEKALRIALGAEIAEANRREREDRTAHKRRA